MEYLGGIITALALLLTAVGGIYVQQKGASRELRERLETCERERRVEVAEARTAQRDAERRAHRAVTVVRRVELWLIERRLLDGTNFEETLREDIEEITSG